MADYIGGRKIALIDTVVAAGVFGLDCVLPTGVSIGILYLLMIVIAAGASSPKACLSWAAISTILTAIASVVSPPSLTPVWDVVDRGLTVLSLWVIAAVVYYLREAREEAARQRAAANRAMEAKARFLSAASHDLRQPVQSLILFTSILNDSLKGHAAEGTANSIAAAVDALKTLLDNVLDISKLDADVVLPNIEAFAVDKVLFRLADEYTPRAAAKGVRLRAVPTGAWTKSDPALVERVLRNLVENAVRYTECGGILIGGRRRGDNIRLDVIDTGPGIAEDQVSRIFEEFYQVANRERSRGQGYGLGLAIVRRTADLLGHGLTIASKEGRGTRFSLLLPLIPPEAEGERAADPGIVANGPGVSVLLIEDDPLVLPALRAALEALNCRVAATSGRAEAMAAAGAHRPALIISDFRLPGGRDGIDVISDIRSLLGSDVPASLITGDIDPTVEERSRSSGMELLRKPVSKADLAALVAETRKRA
jgi:signal transduction histidine kinase